MGADCTCVRIQDLPFRIASNGRRPFSVVVTPNPAQAGKRFDKTIVLYLSVPGPPVTLTIQGRVAPSDDLP